MQNKRIDELLKAMEPHYTKGSVEEVRKYIEELELKASEWIQQKAAAQKKVKEMLDTIDF